MPTNEQLLTTIENYLAQIGFPSEPGKLYAPIGYSLAGGGKRLRPMLLLLACGIYADDPRAALPAAAAVEVFHNFTLLHDDIMDNAPVRRGKPSVFARWGQNVAILSGDAMIISAYRLLTLLPAAKVGFIGLYRDEETLQPVEYFCKLPQDIAERDVLVLDPMLATGGSATDAITQIKKHGAKRIKFIGLIAAPEGIKALHEAHPDVDIYLGAEDDHLNENGYIVPGLGDAGDRIYGTK